MKNLFKTLSFIGLSLSLSLTAQTSSNKANSKADLQSVPQNNFKAAYLSNQDYLSASSMGAYKNTFGDSLKGFDEKKIKNDLLSLGVSGLEIQSHVYHLKRSFINSKYGLGPKLTYLPAPGTSPSNNSNSKPIGGGNVVNVAPCVNEDFELTPPGVISTANGVTGWTISSRSQDGSCSPTNWIPGSPAFSMVATPILNWGSVGSIMGVIPNSPLGGTVVAQLNNQATNDYNSTRLTQTFPVTTANTLFQFAYAGYWQDGGAGHTCCPNVNSQPGLNLKMYDCLGGLLTCSNLSLNPGSGCQSTGVTFSVTPAGDNWTNWQVKYIDLTPYIGSCVTMEVITNDCSLGGHWGSTLFDARCGGQLIGAGLGGAGGSIGGPVSFCAGSNIAQITAPVGYATYQWYAPGTGSVPAPQGTMSTLSVPNPIAGSVYTVQLVAASGCVFTSTNQITTSTVTIAGIGSSSTCPGGASGSATVAGNGSGSGYNYTWISALTSATVGTTAIVNNLAPGIYSIVLTGFGAAGCGSAVSTVTINTAPPGITPLLKPFCSGEAYLGTSGGSNFHWYNGLTPIPAPFGTNPTYTVTSPINNSVYWLSYLSSQGCQDSIQFTLIASQPGLMSIPPPQYICPGGNNGVVQINLSPAPGAPPGLNSYSIHSTGTTPAFSASLFPTGQNTYSVGGLQAGTYTVSVFDGSCKYPGSFNISPFIFDYTVTPQSATLCPGSSLNAAISFTSPPTPPQYSYAWSPSTFLFGTSAQNSIITPVLPVGTTTTIVYSVIVTPSLVNCPITKTISIKAINPPTPTITAIPNLCNTSNPYSILTNPPGGVFNSGITGTNNPISSSGGVITPTLAPFGINTFTYSITQYTCSAKNTATFLVSKFNTAALSSTVPALCVTSPPFNLMNIVQSSVNGSWFAGSPGNPGTGAAGSVGGGNFLPGAASILNTGSYAVTYSTTSSTTVTPNPNTCPSFTTIYVSVTKTITPTITPVLEFCTNAPLINMSVTPAGGGWLPNTNSALSNAGVINPTLVPVPGMTVTYTVNVGPCLNTNTTTLHVSKFYPAGFSTTVNPLCYNSAPVNLMSIVQSTVSGVWNNSVTPMSSNGQVQAILTNSFYPSNLPSDTYIAQYSTLSFPTAGLCNDTRTIAIAVLNPPLPDITPIGPFCNNATAMQLSVTPNSGHWTGSPYVSASGVFTPSLTSVGNNAIQYVIGTNSCNRQQTKNVTIEAFVPATIVSQIPDLCNTSPVLNLVPFTLSGQGAWSGSGISGTNFNPANTSAGHFILTHNTASSPSGLCPDQATISVNVFSLAIPAVTPSGPYCNNSLPFQVNVSPVGGLFGGADMGIISSAGKFNPASALIGDNVINYSITSGPCVAYAQTIIKVEKFISADFAKIPGPFCKTDDAVNMNGYVINPGFDWNGSGNGMTVGGTLFNPAIAKIGSINTVTYTTYSSLANRNLCPDTRTISIEVRDAPTVLATASEYGHCAPFQVVFNKPNSTTGGIGTWNLGDGSEPLTGLNNVSHIFTTPGKYTVQFNYSDDIGCKAAPFVLNPIYVWENPKADFSLPDEVYISDPQIQITNLTTVLTNNTYEWKINGVPQSTMEINPTVTLSKIGKYQITLTATSVNSCTNEITKTIEVKNNFNVFIPNTFSPNFDGLNDYFMPVFTKEGIDTKGFEMEIFDRWGQSLFHTKDINSKGWDGSMQNKGEPLKEEVYVYRIKYKDMDGNTFEKMGNISLIK